MSKRKASSPVELLNGDDDDIPLSRNQNQNQTTTTPKRDRGGATMNPLSISFAASSGSGSVAINRNSSSSRPFKFLAPNAQNEIGSLNRHFLAKIEKSITQNPSACLIPVCESYARHFLTVVIPEVPKSAVAASSEIPKDKSLLGISKFLKALKQKHSISKQSTNNANDVDMEDEDEYSVKKYRRKGQEGGAFAFGLGTSTPSPKKITNSNSIISKSAEKMFMTPMMNVSAASDKSINKMSSSTTTSNTNTSIGVNSKDSKMGMSTSTSIPKNETERKFASVSKPFEQSKEKPAAGNVFKNFQFGSSSSASAASTTNGSNASPSLSFPSPSLGGGLFGVPNTSNLNATSSKMNGITQGLTPPNQTQPFTFKSPSSGFSFGLSGSTANTTKPTDTSTSNNTNAKSQEDDKDNDAESDEPPKNEFRPVVEEDSVYSIRAKLYRKIGDGFSDKGVGQLYVKKLESGKFQIVVRADNNLGTILLNMIISKNLPLTLKPKGVLTCDPKGDVTLIRVKTDEDAKQLLHKLQSYVEESS